MSYKERCLYKSSILDAETESPIYILDSTFFPEELINNFNNFDSKSFTNDLIPLFPKDKFTLVFFTNGFYKYDQNNSNNKPNLKLPVNLVKFLKFIPQSVKDSMIKILIVHGNWISKSIVEILRKFWGYSNKIVHCETLTQLSQNLDLTMIPISLQTYIIDKFQYNNKLILSSRHFEPIYGKPLNFFYPQPFNQFSKIYNNLIAYLTNKKLNIKLSNDDWNTIIQCQILNDETKISVDILSNCLKRDQTIVLSDYSFLEHFLIIVKFILKLSNSNQPLINQESLENFDLSSLESINLILNKILTFRNPLLNLNEKIKTVDSYDNAYILIKIFKLFKYMLMKLEREFDTIEPNGRTPSLKSIEKQKLKLILAYTKILYSDKQSTDDNELEDDFDFDRLFRFIQIIMDKYDDLTVLNTKYSIEDFNNFMSIDDFIVFENFKNQLIGGNEVIEDMLVSTPQPSSQRSPIKSHVIQKESKTNNLPKTENDDAKEEKQSPPTPPLPRKSNILTLNEYPETPTRKSKDSTSNNPTTSISISQSDISILANQIDDFDLEPIKFRTPLKPVKPIDLKSASVKSSSNTPMKPSELNPNSIKYTEKDKEILDKSERERVLAEEKAKSHKEVEKSAVRGERKVSRLARMYEEKLLAE